MTATIDVRGLVKHYGDVRAVDGVDFTVEPGEFFGILGPNGAGKTTTLELIEGLRKPDEGQIQVLGHKPWPRNVALLPKMGVQLQASAFFERLSAREQLESFAALFSAPRARVSEMLDLVGLKDKASTRVEKLSGGQQQRLSIAAALLHDPEIVFLDEPTAALDPQARRNLWGLLREINDRGSTVVLTTHYMDEAEILCDRVAIMDHGKVLAIDTPQNLIRGLDAATRIILPEGALSVEEAQALVGADSAARVSLDSAGEDAAGVDNGSLTLMTRRPAEVLTTLAERDLLDGLAVRGATLEDVFLELTGREYRA